MEILISKSEEETIRLGSEFAKKLKSGGVVALYGDLGSGKTQFVKGVCRLFDVKEVVNSPTFTIVNEYHGTMPTSKESIRVFHIDLYRLKNIEEIFGIGYYEYLESGGICLVEWAEKLDGIIPEERFDVKFSVVDETTREITLADVGGRN
ncbi:MAG TPA: tRNA (adenosine(37)-N6)-threonylcarbamoyltransferase complex ATPase subunit type 1 TsaE [Candidatus Acidoferrales bacterium]|nr:tRNA (adenosine(37)-N6)-threonylcarbamoyltransferase complex ATPase subunit type 1 TsaE [Candidatus Acidoferrales bacterium]